MRLVKHCAAPAVLALGLLSCGGGGDGNGPADPPPTVLAVVEVDSAGGSAFAAPTMAVSFGARTPVDDFDPVPVFPVADLDSNDDYTVWEAPTTDPLFAVTVAALTDGQPSDVGYRLFATLHTWGPETSDLLQILEPMPGMPDLSGRVIERIALVVDEVTVDSPGSDPNNDGQWVDFALRGRFLVYGR